MSIRNVFAKIGLITPCPNDYSSQYELDQAKRNQKKSNKRK